jgi:hypothetical protein
VLLVRLLLVSLSAPALCMKGLVRQAAALHARRGAGRVAAGGGAAHGQRDCTHCSARHAALTEGARCQPVPSGKKSLLPCERALFWTLFCGMHMDGAAPPLLISLCIVWICEHAAVCLCLPRRAR